MYLNTHNQHCAAKRYLKGLKDVFSVVNYKIVGIFKLHLSKKIKKFSASSWLRNKSPIVLLVCFFYTVKFTNMLNFFLLSSTCLVA